MLVCVIAYEKNQVDYIKVSSTSTLTIEVLLNMGVLSAGAIAANKLLLNIFGILKWGRE